MMQDYINIMHETSARIKALTFRDPHGRALAQCKAAELRIAALEAEDYMILQQHLKYKELINEK